jgi:hypothetical protein
MLWIRQDIWRVKSNARKGFSGRFVKCGKVHLVSLVRMGGIVLLLLVATSLPQASLSYHMPLPTTRCTFGATQVVSRITTEPFIRPSRHDLLIRSDAMHLWLQSDPTLNRNVLNTATQVNQQVELAAFLLYHLQFSRSTEIKGPAAHALVGMQLCLRKK